jgi:hypothetical protein
MTETPAEAPRSALKRRLLVVPIALLVGLAGLFAYATLYATTTELVLGCLEGGGLLSPDLACTYLEVVRDPDPNEQDPEPSLVASPASAHPQTIFGFTLAGYDSSNPRSVRLVDHFIAKGVDWSKPHDVGLTPLHLAVLSAEEDLVERFVASGASPTARADDPGKSYHGQSVLEFLAAGRRGGPERTPSAETVQVLDRIEKRLTAD